MSDRHAVVIPEEPAGAVRCWRKLVTAVQPGGRDAYALAGAWLDADKAYELPEGAAVIACDRFPENTEVVLYQVHAGVLDTVKAWPLKAPLGKRVTDFTARRLAKDAAGHKAVPLEELANLYDGRCAHCRQAVHALTGVRWRDRDGEHTAHRKGECPPPPPPPPRVEPNMYGGACLWCGGWVEPETGAAVLGEAAEPGQRGRYRAVHREPCPADPLPGPLNSRDGWCSECCGIVPARAGCWLLQPDGTRQLHCHPRCPGPGPDGPGWVVRTESAHSAGEVIAARADLRNGGPAVQAGVPGYRALDDHGLYIQFCGVITAVIRGRYGKWETQVRAASWEEAAPLLAAEAEAALIAAPHPPGYRGAWHAEIIGPHRPWLARLDGHDPDYGFRREFLRPKEDWLDANRKGTRGVQCWWTLALNEVYEACWRLTWNDERRGFLRVTPGGDVVTITREEAEAWLSMPHVR
jgi:hypothetical protein